MKFSVSVYSFMQYIQDGRLTPFSCIEKVKEMGFDAIEYVDFAFPEDEDPTEYAKKLRAETWNGSGGDLEAEVERLKGQVDIAAILGCPTMRHDVTGGIANRTYQGYDNVVERLAKGCRAVAEYAAQKGIRRTTAFSPRTAYGWRS